MLYVDVSLLILRAVPSCGSLRLYALALLSVSTFSTSCGVILTRLFVSFKFSFKISHWRRSQGHKVARWGFLVSSLPSSHHNTSSSRLHLKLWNAIRDATWTRHTKQQERSAWNLCKILQVLRAAGPTAYNACNIHQPLYNPAFVLAVMDGLRKFGTWNVQNEVHHFPQPSSGLDEKTMRVKNYESVTWNDNLNTHKNYKTKIFETQHNFGNIWLATHHKGTCSCGSTQSGRAACKAMAALSAKWCDKPMDSHSWEATRSKRNDGTKFQSSDSSPELSCGESWSSSSSSWFSSSSWSSWSSSSSSTSQGKSWGVRVKVNSYLTKSTHQNNTPKNLVNVQMTCSRNQPYENHSAQPLSHSAELCMRQGFSSSQLFNCRPL